MKKTYNICACCTFSNALYIPFNFISPIYRDIYVVVSFNLSCVIFGLPLNVYIAKYCYIYDEPFKNWHFFSFFFPFLATIIEIISCFVDDFCRFQVLLTGLPQLIVLLNLFLSLVECYTKEKRLNPHVIAVLNLSLALGVNWIYISGLAPLRCGYQKAQLVTLALIFVVLFFSCVVLKIFIDVKNKRLRRQFVSISRTMAVKKLFSTRPPQDESVIVLPPMQPTEAETSFLASSTISLTLICPLIALIVSYLIYLPFQNDSADWVWLVAASWTT